MLTRIRNAVRNRAATVKCLNNKLNRGVCQALVDEGYITKFDVVDDGRTGFINVHLKYGPRGSRSSTRSTACPSPLPRVPQLEGHRSALQGMGITVVSTSSG
jgi:small subunit ribosomal protein S8